MLKSTTGWNETIKKQARGVDGSNLGEVRSVERNYVVTEKGRFSKSRYYIPKYLVRDYDGQKLWFNVTEKQAEIEFKRAAPPNPDEYYKYRMPDTPIDVEDWIPTASSG